MPLDALPVPSESPVPRRHSYLILSGLVALLLAGGAAPRAVRATALTVPDEAASIQEALDARVDTVLIRPGNYPETVAVSWPGILMMGASGDSADMPTVAGVKIYIYRSDLYPAVYAFQGLRFNNRAVIVNNRNNADVSFVRCALGGGAVDSSAHGDTGDITFSKCRLDGLVKLIAKGTIALDSCAVTGHVVFGNSPSSVVVRGCKFQGARDEGSSFAITSTGHYVCSVEGNTIRGYAAGVYANGDFTVVSNNLIEDAPYIGIDAEQNDVRVVNNVIRRCGRGIYAASSVELWIIGNTVTDAGLDGLDVGDGTDVNILGNVFWRCGANGMKINNSGGRVYVKVRQNSSCYNGLSGYVSDSYQWQQEWIGNIGCANGLYGINWLTADVATIACNDWFGNGAGDVGGRPPSSEDSSADPQFCDAASGDFRLNSASPLVKWPGCGPVGALGMGCGETATVVQRFTAERVGDDVRVVWEVAEGATASEVSLERSEAMEAMEGDAWARPVTERSMEGRRVVELDRSAVSDRRYGYRLVALEGNDVTVIGSAIFVEALARLEFKLVRVGPSPGSGPVMIVFALKHAAAIEIDVFDVQGRRVASPARGTWPAGTHMVGWNGLTRNGEAAPSGLYLLRYAYPGGQDRRRLVRVP